MRVNPEPVQQQHLAARRRSVVILACLAGLAIAVVVVQGLASFYVNYLWFNSAGVGMVWRAIVASKLGLAGVFVVVAMALVWSSLWLADKIAQRTLFLPAESDLVRRYHAAVFPHAFLLRTAVSLLVALALGAGTSSQWEHWLLFNHAVRFGVTDPEFHRDASFYIFRLPFLSFLVDWTLVALLVTFLVSLLAHFLNGTIRVQGPAHVEPRAIAHLSLLLGVMALVRAWAYYYVDRYALEVPHNGAAAAAAGSTGISVRLPAITLLAVISLIAFVMLVVNVYQRTLLLPLLAFGLWAMIALAIEVIYPSVESAVAAAPLRSGHTTPALSANAQMTWRGMGLTDVTPIPFPAGATLTSSVLTHYDQSLEDVTLWDNSQASGALSAVQDLGPYQLVGLSENRYVENGKLVPVDVAVRELDDGELADQSWTSLHVLYTHGYGVVVSPTNAASSSGDPVVQLGGLPPSGSSGAPSLSAAGSRIYFSPGGPEFVLVDTKEQEVDYQTSSGNTRNITAPYDAKNSVAIPIGGFLPRLAFFVHLRDFNLLVSDVVTPSTRVLYLTDVRHRVQKALPFMKVDTEPYAVIAGGQLYWVYSAYVTSSYYPDATPAETSVLPAGSGLAGNYDYVRDAVVAVVNARSGTMRIFALQHAGDPLLQSYEDSFPGLIESPQSLRAFAGGQIYDHLRYPQQLLAVQAAMYGLFRPVAGGSAASAGGVAAAASSEESWSLAEAPPTSPSSSSSSSSSGSGSPAPTPYQPQYELVQWEDDPQPTFSLVEPLVPYSGTSGTGGSQTLSALMVASSSPNDFGALQVLDVDTNGVEGPAPAAAFPVSVSNRLADLAQDGTLSYGAMELLPIADSLIDIEPVYVTTPTSHAPVFVGVVVVYGKKTAFASSLDEALAELVHGLAPPASSRPAATGPVSAQIKHDLAEAAEDIKKANEALGRKDLAGFQRYYDAEERVVDAAEKLEQAGSASSGSSRATRRTTGVAARASSSESAAQTTPVLRAGLRAAAPAGATSAGKVATPVGSIAAVTSSTEDSGRA